MKGVSCHRNPKVNNFICSFPKDRTSIALHRILGIVGTAEYANNPLFSPFSHMGSGKFRRHVHGAGRFTTHSESLLFRVPAPCRFSSPRSCICVSGYSQANLWCFAHGSVQWQGNMLKARPSDRPALPSLSNYVSVFLFHEHIRSD